MLETPVESWLSQRRPAHTETLHLSSPMGAQGCLTSRSLSDAVRMEPFHGLEVFGCSDTENGASARIREGKYYHKKSHIKEGEKS